MATDTLKSIVQPTHYISFLLLFLKLWFHFDYKEKKKKFESRQQPDDLNLAQPRTISLKSVNATAIPEEKDVRKQRKKTWKHF